VRLPAPCDGYSYERLQGDGRDDPEAQCLNSKAEEAWIRKGERGGQQGGAKIQNGSQSFTWICTGLEEGLEPDHLDAVEMGGRPDLRRRRD
jgi:hypothetical protein